MANEKNTVRGKGFYRGCIFALVYVLCNCIYPINEECPGTFRHRGYYEKIYLYVL